MKHYTITIDDDQVDLLIDLLATAIAEAERNEYKVAAERDRPTVSAEAMQIVTAISVGTPILDDLRSLRGGSVAADDQDDEPAHTPSDRSN